MESDGCIRITTNEVLNKIPGPSGERFATAFARGSLLIELYQPLGHDPQLPHTRDEAYVIIEGRGIFVMGDKRSPFTPGDFLFAPAGALHRFEDFGESFTAWVIFFGPEGGEKL